MNGDRDRLEALRRYGRFYETLRRDGLDRLDGLVAPDVRFKDPFNDVRGIAAMTAVLGMMYDHGTPRFEVTDRALGEGGAGYLRWRYTSTPAGTGRPWVVEGMTEIHFDARGLVAEHIDHWDAAEQFYERLPLIGWLIRRVRLRLRVREAGR